MAHLCWECGIPYGSESKNICEPDTKTQTKKQNGRNRWRLLLVSIRVWNSSCLIEVQKTLSCRSTCKCKYCSVFKSGGFNGQINTFPSTCKYCLLCFVKLEMAPWQMAWAHSINRHIHKENRGLLFIIKLITEAAESSCFITYRCWNSHYQTAPTGQRVSMAFDAPQYCLLWAFPGVVSSQGRISHSFSSVLLQQVSLQVCYRATWLPNNWVFRSTNTNKVCNKNRITLKSYSLLAFASFSCSSSSQTLSIAVTFYSQCCSFQLHQPFNSLMNFGVNHNNGKYYFKKGRKFRGKRD